MRHGLYTSALIVFSSEGWSKIMVYEPIKDTIDIHYVSNNRSEAYYIRPIDGKNRTEPIKNILKKSLISPFVERDGLAPLSMMLIAPTESNKTRLLLSFPEKTIPHVKVIENLSAKPLNRLIAQQDKKQEIFDIIILDYNRTLEAKTPVVTALTGTELNLTDEGCKESLYFGQKYKLHNRIQMGIIGGITPELFNKHFPTWNKNGLLTRRFPISWHYSETTRKDIQDSIAFNLKSDIEQTAVKIRKYGKKDIPIDNNMSAAIEIETEKLRDRLLQFYVAKNSFGKEYKVFYNCEGFRLQKMLRLFAKCIAYDNKHFDGVNFEDLRELQRLVEYIGFPTVSYEKIQTNEKNPDGSFKTVSKKVYGKEI